jgi:hypothetical protein
MLIKDLIDRLPANTKERVEETKKNFNKSIRDSIRFELRLSLNSGQDHEIEEEQGIYTKITIKIDAGYPKKIENFRIPDEHRTAAILSQIRPELVRLKDSSTRVTRFILDYQDIEVLSDFVGGALCYAEEEASNLLRIVDAYDLVKEILNIDNHILGCYRFQNKPSSVHSNPFGPILGEVLLFWGVIGLVSTRLGVEVEALTAVVLAHELAHAYSHLGFDIDGKRWDNEGFKNSDSSVKEGLAQYYTERVIGRLQPKIPGAWDAYIKLLEKQNRDYCTHKIWMDEIHVTPETVRSALIQLKGVKKTG